MANYAGVNTSHIAGLVLGFLVGAGCLPVYGENDTGPGTGKISIPQTFSPVNFSTLRLGTKPIPWQTSPAVLASLGACVDPLGGPVKSPIEFDLRITTPDAVNIPWVVGETHEIHLMGRSSSNRFVLTPPLITLVCTGGAAGSVQLSGGPWKVGDDPIFWVIPSLSNGSYRLHAFDQSTGMCKASEFSFIIAASNPTPTPTETPLPTGTSTLTHTPTNSLTPTNTTTRSYTNTPTPTATAPPPTHTSTNTRSVTPTPTRTVTPTKTPSPISTPIPSSTSTQTPSSTPSQTSTPTATELPSGITRWQEY